MTVQAATAANGNRATKLVIILFYRQVWNIILPSVPQHDLLFPNPAVKRHQKGSSC